MRLFQNRNEMKKKMEKKKKNKPKRCLDPGEMCEMGISPGSCHDTSEEYYQVEKKDHGRKT